MSGPTSPESAPAMEAALLNTLFIQNPKARLGVSNGCFRVSVEGREVLRPPLHEVKSVVLIGRVETTGAAIELASRLDVPIGYISPGGDFRGMFANGNGSLEPGASGEESLAARREQWRLANAAEEHLAVARQMVRGKIDNARALLLKTARRPETDAEDTAAIEKAAGQMDTSAATAENAKSLSELLGHEGAAGRAFFSVLERLVRPAARQDFTFQRRTRRPPRDPFNALLSFLYALLCNECVGAVRAAGLEAAIGFLHNDRLGRPALAFDLMEELRPLAVDRLAIALVNRRQLLPEHFDRQEQPDDTNNTPGEAEHPAVLLNEEGRKIVLAAWRERLCEEIQHPLSGRTVPWKLLPHLQAAHLRGLLARGEAGAYRPFRPRL